MNEAGPPWVQSVFEFENFAAHIDRDLARQVTARHGGSDFSDVRTWPVRFEAIKFTLSVRSFHVPATPGTCACPPSFPSVPTSRATRVTSAAKALSWSHHRIDGVLEFENFAFHVDRDLARQVAASHSGRDFGNISDLTGKVSGHRVHGVG